MDFPILTPENISKLLQTRTISNFHKLTKKFTLEEYLKTNLTTKEKSELKFVPKIEVLKFRDPKKNIFTGFRSLQKNGALVFALLPKSMLPICAEFRHGCERVILTLPGGLIETSDKNPQVAAEREFKEEIGIPLKKLIPLNITGIPLDARSSTRKNFFFLGIPQIPLKTNEQKPIKNEFIARFLIHINYWLTLMEHGLVDECAIAGTLLALKKLKHKTIES